MSKKAIRQLISQRLAAISPGQVDSQTRKIAETVRQLDEYRQARSIALYMELDKEAGTGELIRNAFEDHKTVFLPRIAPVDPGYASFPAQKTHLEMLKVPDQKTVDSLKPTGKYKIREPEAGDNALHLNGIDLIIVPGVAFTSECHRLGHGKGFYDSYIEEHTKRAGFRPSLVAVALVEQLVDTIPAEPHDKQMDAVVFGDAQVARPIREKILK